MFTPGLDRLLLSALLLTPAVALATPRHIRIPQLPPETRDLFHESMRLSAEAFDPSRHLITRPTRSHSNARGSFMVRESSWYALGLLARDNPTTGSQPSDRDLAAAILRTILAQQYRTPGAKWFGTFKRTPEEPEPVTGTVPFTGYDPNWREFIGTTFQTILIEYPDRIPPDLARQLYASIDLAVQGEISDGRLKETYSNIALMYGALWDFAASHNHNTQWIAGALQWTEEVNRLFRLHNTFSEFNSPTYYGVDLYGLALWRQYGSTPRLRTLGTEIESVLWSDIADFYQPQLRNISGPYDRSYGMDMESYVAVTGTWLRAILPATQAPLPNPLNLATDHVADIFFAPQIAILGTRIPTPALNKFNIFAGPHLVTRQIDSERTATAWIGPHVIWGGEATSFTRSALGETQFHPATVQWRTPSGPIGWIQLVHAPKLNVTADQHGLTITSEPGDLTLLLQASGATVGSIADTHWLLPGLSVSVQTDGTPSVEAHPTPQAPNGIEVTLKHATRLHLTITTP